MSSTLLDRKLTWAARAGDRAKVETLLAQGAQSQLPEESSALDLAIVHGHLDLVKLFVEHGADVNRINMNGQTPLIQALMMGNREAVDLLLNLGADVNGKDRWGATGLHWGHWGGKGGVAMQMALSELLMAHGANINALDPAGRTPLFWLLDSDRYAGDIVQFFVKSGADPLVRDAKTLLPIHVAAANASVDALREILNISRGLGLSVDVHDGAGQTPLHHAAKADHRDNLICLMNEGAMIHALDASGKTPMDAARDSRSFEAIELIKAWGNAQQAKRCIDQVMAQPIAVPLSHCP